MKKKATKEGFIKLFENITHTDSTKLKTFLNESPQTAPAPSRPDVQPETMPKPVTKPEPRPNPFAPDIDPDTRPKGSMEEGEETPIKSMANKLSDMIAQAVNKRKQGSNPNPNPQDDVVK